jgi:hypothetical protein
MPIMKPAVILTTALLAMPVLAQEAGALPLQAEADQFVLTVFDQQLKLPLPDWLELADATPDALLERVSVNFREDTTQARVEIYPRGEGEALWSRLYGARIFQQPELTLADLRTAVIDVYGRTCKPETVALFQLEPDDGDKTPPLGFVCGAHRDRLGYEAQGEVMIIGFYRSASGIAMVYQEWRGETFDPQDATTWPVSAEQVEARVAEFKTLAGFDPAD